MDLTQVEALSDLLNAQTKHQSSQALRQLNGALGTIYHKWSDEMTKCLAHVEYKLESLAINNFRAILDFSESETDVVATEIYSKVIPKIDSICIEIDSLLNENCGERLREGLNVVLIGYLLWLYLF